MRSYKAKYLILLISSSLPLIVAYYKIPAYILESGLTLALVVLLLGFKRVNYLSSKASPKSSVSSTIELTALFSLSSFLQLLVYFTGDFYSPFLILFHLFAFCLAFFLNPKLALTFLIFAVSTLILNTLILDTRIHNIFISDPGPIILYLISFLIIIPLFWIVASRYNLKYKVSEILNAQLQLRKREDKLIFGGLSDLVITTDLDLNILSANDATARLLSASPSELVGQPLLNVLFLRNTKGEMLNNHNLSPGTAINPDTSLVITDLFLYTKNSSCPKKVRVGIGVSTDLKEKIDHLIFIISGPFNTSDSAYHNIEPAILKNDSIWGELKNILSGPGLEELRVKIGLLHKWERDVLITTELEDHSLKPNLALIDIAKILPSIISRRQQDLPKTLGPNIYLDFDPRFPKPTTLEVTKDHLVPILLTSPHFTVLTDPKWVDILLGKILDLSLLVHSNSKDPSIHVLLSYDDKNVFISVNSTCPYLPDNYQEVLLNKHYINSDYKNVLNLGSGLEGYLVKTIATYLNTFFNLQYHPQAHFLSITLQLTKKPPQWLT